MPTATLYRPTAGARGQYVVVLSDVRDGDAPDLTVGYRSTRSSAVRLAAELNAGLGAVALEAVVQAVAEYYDTTTTPGA